MPACVPMGGLHDLEARRVPQRWITLVCFTPMAAKCKHLSILVLGEHLAWLVSEECPCLVASLEQSACGSSFLLKKNQTLGQTVTVQKCSESHLTAPHLCCITAAISQRALY